MTSLSVPAGFTLNCGAVSQAASSTLRWTQRNRTRRSSRFLPGHPERLPSTGVRSNYDCCRGYSGRGGPVRNNKWTG